MPAEVIPFRPNNSAQNTNEINLAPKPQVIPQEESKSRGLTFEWIETFRDKLALLERKIDLPSVMELAGKYGYSYSLSSDVPEIDSLTQWERIYLIYEMSKTAHDYWARTHELGIESVKFRFVPFELVGVEEFCAEIEDGNLLEMLKSFEIIKDKADIDSATHYFLLKRNDFCEEHGLKQVKDIERFIRKDIQSFSPISEEGVKYLAKNPVVARVIAERIAELNPGKFA